MPSPCDGCHKRDSEFVLYCRCESRRTRLQLCGHCIPSGAVRRSDFAFKNPQAQCDECANDADCFDGEMEESR